MRNSYSIGHSHDESLVILQSKRITSCVLNLEILNQLQKCHTIIKALKSLSLAFIKSRLQIINDGFYGLVVFVVIYYYLEDKIY